VLILKTIMFLYVCSAASIWFEVWGVVNPVAEIFDSSREKFRFSWKRFSRQKL